MADYPIISPANLANLDETMPLNTEDPSKIAEIDRQTRTTIKAVIKKEHNEDGTHKALSTSSLADLSVTSAKLSSSGSDDSLRSVTTNSIKDGAVTTPKLATKAVTDAKLASSASTDADRAVGTDHIKDKAITAAKLADGTITSIQLGANSIGSTQLKSHASDDSARAVGADHIKTGAVTATKIPDDSITVGKLGSFGNLKVAVGDGATDVVAASIGGDITATLVAGVLTLRVTNLVQTIPYAIIQESGTAGGAAAAATWNNRPIGGGSALAEQSDTQNMVSLSLGNIVFAQAGTYLIHGFGVGYSVGLHQLRLYDNTNSVTALVGSLAAAPAGVQNQSVIQGVIVVAANNTSFKLQHWTELAKGTNGLGLASASGETQVFANLEILRLV